MLGPCGRSRALCLSWAPDGPARYAGAVMTTQTRITRRGLLQSIGTASLVAGCKAGTEGQAPPVSPRSPAVEGEQVGPEATRLAFALNGAPVDVQAEPRTTLLALLRDDLGFTGTKEGCDRGACGACTVLVNGAAQNACMLLAHDVAGASVTTVEGLAPAGEVGPLQRQFVAHDALQCGFCTSGMLVSCSALLKRTADVGGQLTAEQVNTAISGNLCRCGSYPHIVDAVLATAREQGLA
ncbi:MAG: (2Fe-2S)-binding protein [Myxococcales bacterium FL481]|nr:MAG: (2Fe-2S)-binding protein [Myxococcales bacterium FL481]